MSRDKRDCWPVDERGRPLAPRAQPGYYPGYSTLSQQAFWDEATRRTVLERVNDVPAIRFFSSDEAAFLQVVVDRVLPQDDRDAAHKIPIVPFIDERLHRGESDGYRYQGMPPDGEAHRLGLRGIEAGARAMFGRSFLELEPGEQEGVLKTLHDNRPVGGEEIWQRMEAHRYFLLLLHDAARVYYAHPWAWDEIGYGGPAYPRGYMRLERGEPEPWEVDERRYEWEPPPSAESHRHEQIAGGKDPYLGGGQGSTH